MANLKIAYFGTPIFSAKLLEQLINEKSLPIEIVLVVTQPDKPVGKKGIITPSPVKVVAQKYGIEVWDRPIAKSKVKGQSEDMGDFSSLGAKGHPTGVKNDHIELYDKLRQIDLAVVFAFGFKQLIPLDLLKAPKIQFKIGEGKTSGFVNIHPSLLPQYRGSSPIAYPILLSENKTGVTLFVMDEKMDHGPIIAKEETEIRLNDVRPNMEMKLTNLGFEMIKKLLSSLTREPVNSLILKSQNDSFATRSPYMTKDDGFLPFSTLQKALKNEVITIQELPHIIRNYIEKYYIAVGDTSIGIPTARSRGSSYPKRALAGKYEWQNLLQNTDLTIYNFWRGMLPWPGVWTKIIVNNEEKRLKITEMKFENEKLLITKVQLEGKKEVDFSTFQKAYGI